LIVSGVIAQRGADTADALEKGEWHTYSGTFASHRYSPLTEISTTNVASLRPVWMYQPSGTGPLEGTPIVMNGVMYVTSGPASVVALDLTSGRPLWQWTRPISPGVLSLGFPRENRGVAGRTQRDRAMDRAGIRLLRYGASHLASHALRQAGHR
jgi:alcohol dehydrogenase (cytochrome c)